MSKSQRSKWLSASLLVAVLLASSPFALLSLRAEDDADATGPGSTQAKNGSSKVQNEIEAKAEAARRRLEQYQHSLRRTKAQQMGVEHNVSVLGEERAHLNKVLISMARRIQDGETTLSRIEQRLGELSSEESLIRGSLAQRHGKISSLLASMQRIGRQPPPVIITQRKDALKMVRSAMLLGSLYPQLKNQADELAGKLTNLMLVTNNIRSERDQQKKQKRMYEDNRRNIKVMMARKRARLIAKKAQLASLRSVASMHRKSVANISELIKKLNKEIEAKSQLGKYEKKLREGKAGRGSKKTAFVNPGRIEPAVAFHKTRGMLPLPVAGKRLRSYGDNDKFGAISKGIVMQTRHEAQVTAPADGWVVYAGPFRRYGNLLIINAGGGYHILLAGMKRIDVSLSQFVTTGEPIGVMESRSGQNKGRENSENSRETGSSARLQKVEMSGNRAPTLYIEFRKKGRPVNPDPWWNRAARMGGKGKV